MGLSLFIPKLSYAQLCNWGHANVQYTIYMVRKSSATIWATDFGVLSMRQKGIGCAKSAVY